jgi:ATP-dependent Clp protease, protease subunit
MADPLALISAPTTLPDVIGLVDAGEGVHLGQLVAALCPDPDTVSNTLADLLTTASTLPDQPAENAIAESNLTAQEAATPTEAGAADVPPLHERKDRAVGTTNLGTSEELYERLLRERIIVLGAQIEEESANQIAAQLLRLAAEDATKDIRLYINSPGGSITAGMAIYDTMQFIECDVATYVLGLAAGMAQVLLSAGTPGKRYALPQARILLRGPTIGDGVTESDDTIQAEMLNRYRWDMAELIARHTGQTSERVLADWDPERWFSAEQAREYGLLDHVLTRIG